MPMISYAHKDDPQGQRFCQDADDGLPMWAVNIRPYVEPEALIPPATQVSPDLVFEWVKTGHWCRGQFLAWLVEQTDAAERSGWRDGFDACVGVYDR